MLETEAFRKKPEEVAGILSEVKPEYHTHPAFFNFLDKTFTNRLSFDARKFTGMNSEKQ
jgi:hypothetical protein